MNCIYLDFAHGQSLNDSVTSINGVPGSYGTLLSVTSSNISFMWGQWTCGDAIPCCDSTITAIGMTNGGGSYNVTLTALVGGRPPRPIAR